MFPPKKAGSPQPAKQPVHAATQAKEEKPKKLSPALAKAQAAALRKPKQQEPDEGQNY